MLAWGRKGLTGRKESDTKPLAVTDVSVPRKPQQAKQQVTVVVNGTPVAVTLHPPAKSRRSWYAYWAGADFSRSTGCDRFEDALVVAQKMLGNSGKRSQFQDTVLTDEEFVEIQRRHFGKKKGDAAQARAEKSLKETLDAISAFRAISQLESIGLATPADCEAFQEAALRLPKNWRQQFPKSKKDADQLSPTTVLKWCRHLQAAFERANRSGGKKCVRGIVDEAKLLIENPWKQFTWIQAEERPLRQFNADELISILDFFVERWDGVTAGPILAKMLLWSWGRRDEITRLRWDQLRAIDNEFHFHTLGKWGVEKWFRVPLGLHSNLQAIRTGSPYVFSAYPRQLQDHYRAKGNHHLAAQVKDEFCPENLGDWFHHRIRDWSGKLPNGRATPHVFRKTSLQIARRGEDLNRQVAKDAKLTEAVMMKNYVNLADGEMRAASNRTFQRLVRSLPPHVAREYGHIIEPETSQELEAQLRDATERKE
jgi:integrase